MITCTDTLQKQLNNDNSTEQLMMQPPTEETNDNAAKSESTAAATEDCASRSISAGVIRDQADGHGYFAAVNVK